MRALFAAFCAAGILASVVSSSPLTRNKRFAISTAGNPYGAVMASAGFNPLAFSPFFGAGFPFNFVPVVNYQPFTFPVFKNWYEGENVCKEERVMNSQMPDDLIPDDWKTGLPETKVDYSHQQESCRGTNQRYVCMKRAIGKNGEAEMIATKYECCHGFVRDPTGAPGCVESTQTVPAGASKGTNEKLSPNDDTYYIYTGNKMLSGSSMSSSSRSSSGNIDKVPIQ